jgi:two-component system sensor histidine kinase KdpD
MFTRFRPTGEDLSPSTVACVRTRAGLLLGLLASAAAVAAVSGIVYVLKPHVPVLSLGALYVLAVLPVAIVWGTALAAVVSVASMLAFNWFFLPPYHSFHLRESQNWLALGVYLAIAFAVGALAARARARRDDAEQRRAESDALAEAALDLLRGRTLDEELGRLAALMAGVLGLEHVRLALGEQTPEPGERALPVEAGLRCVATLFVDEDATVDESVRRRFLPSLAALLAVVVERSRLEGEALEAEALRRSDALKTALLRTVSHDLRSPLTAILASADALASPGLNLEPEERLGLAQTIRGEATRLDRVVEQLLDLSRLEAGAIEPHRELWPVDELVGQALAGLGAEAGRVRLEIGPETPPVEVDAAQIERVLANLLDNAIQYSPPGSHVLVRAEQGATELRLHVVDSGTGLPAEQREALFQPFSRGSAGRGSGLGLAIARGFADANGGRLWAQDDPAGGHLVLSLPLAARPAAVIRT